MTSLLTLQSTNARKCLSKLPNAYSGDEGGKVIIFARQLGNYTDDLLPS